MLAVSNLAVARGGVPVLEGVNFSLGAGRALFLRGPNGSGKTTLLRTLAGLQPALAGDLDYDPETVAYGSHADGIKATLTVAENLAFWRDIYRGPPVEQGLEAFDIRHLRDRFAQNLSAGQKRRLGLARLLMTGRPVWILDEPTVSLDAEGVALFATTIQAHLTGGGAALIATHITLGFEAQSLDITPFKARPKPIEATW